MILSYNLKWTANPHPTQEKQEPIIQSYFKSVNQQRDSLTWTPAYEAEWYLI